MLVSPLQPSARFVAEGLYPSGSTYRCELGVVFVLPNRLGAAQELQQPPLFDLRSCHLGDESAPLPGTDKGIDLFEQPSRERNMCSFCSHGKGPLHMGVMKVYNFLPFFT